MLHCEGGTFYTGITNNLEKRFALHRAGKASKYTRSHKPLRILYTEHCNSRSEALKREMVIKSLNRKEKSQMVEQKKSVTKINMQFNLKPYEEKTSNI